ncbi:Bro-N domain-containing protein [Acinetobacter pittii]|uniref:BRO-N domain-containing protein n=1 Tax=Acinetobacter pittii TaxID=48296 RepID=UPI002A055F43|nr:BRO family protein [Acinetobacter pittii]MDX8160979.1 BRO family protein [Acinetobacter pittii]MDX8265506.1 BRO family protein [Acinetobacter pittii]
MSSLALSFNDVNFSPVQHNNQIWLTASELAKALGYAKSDAVTQIYERNKDEFNSEMTLTLKLSVKGFGNGNSLKETRIFNPRGCHLITFFARTSVAKQFRKWVLDVLDKEIGAPVAKTHKSEREPLTNAVNLLVAKTKHLNYSDAYKLVHQRFNVQHIDEIPYDAIPVAVEYVHHLIAMYSKAEKYKDTEPHTHTVLRDKNVQFLMWYVPILAKFIKNEISPALTAIQSAYAGPLFSLAQESVTHANVLNRKAIGYGITRLEHVDNQRVHTIEWYLSK